MGLISCVTMYYSAKDTKELIDQGLTGHSTNCNLIIPLFAMLHFLIFQLPMQKKNSLNNKESKNIFTKIPIQLINGLSKASLHLDNCHLCWKRIRSITSLAIYSLFQKNKTEKIIYLQNSPEMCFHLEQKRLSDHFCVFFFSFFFLYIYLVKSISAFNVFKF